MRSTNYIRVLFIIVVTFCKMVPMEKIDGPKNILSLKELCLKAIGEAYHHALTNNKHTLNERLDKAAEIVGIPEILLAEFINYYQLRMVHVSKDIGETQYISFDHSVALIKKKGRCTGGERETIYRLSLVGMRADWIKNLEAQEHIIIFPSGQYAASWSTFNNKVFFRIFHIASDREDFQFQLNVECLQNVFFVDDDKTILIVGKNNQTEVSHFFWISGTNVCPLFQKESVLSTVCAAPYFAYCFLEDDHITTCVMKEQAGLVIALKNFFCLSLSSAGLIVGRRADNESNVVVIHFIENKALGEFDHQEKVQCGVLDPANAFLACATSSHLYFWDIASKNCLARLELAHIPTHFSWARNNSSFIMADHQDLYYFEGSLLSFWLCLFKKMLHIRSHMSES